MQSIAILSEFAGHLCDLIRTTPPAESSWTDEVFGELALKLFALQCEYNEAYRRLCQAKVIVQGRKIQNWPEIPAVPTSAFKDLQMTCLPAANRTSVFHSSGTTEHRPSRHFHNAESLLVYEESLLAWFSRQFQIEQRIPMLCLTPSPELEPHSSLVYMFESLRRKFGSERSEFLGRVDKDGGWALNVEVAVEALRRGVEMGGPMLILGTAFSYVHLLDYLTDLGISFNLPAGTRVMETGGYKGRSRSLPKDQLHQLICERLGILRTDVICEYGMSELSSQAYDQPPIDPPSASRSSRCEENPNSKSEPHEADERKFHRGDNESGIGLPHSTTLARNSGIFHFPPWARAQIISPETGREVNDGETGLIRVFDLANVSSVMAIQTEDLGVRRGDGFELVGRASLAEARGCSLMAV